MLNLEDFLEKNTIYKFRFKSILMPPIINNSPIEALNMIMIYIHLKNEVSISSYENWFFETFSQSRSKSYNTRKILERSNFILVTPDKILKLTHDGEKYININEDEKKILMARNFTEAYIGFLEFLSICNGLGENEIDKAKLFIEWNNSLDCEFNRTIKTAKEQFYNITKYLYYLNLIEKKKSNNVNFIPNINSIDSIIKIL